MLTLVPRCLTPQLAGTCEERRREAVGRLVLNGATRRAIEHLCDALEIDVRAIVADIVFREKGEIVHGSEDLSTARATKSMPSHVSTLPLDGRCCNGQSRQQARDSLLKAFGK